MIKHPFFCKSVDGLFQAGKKIWVVLTARNVDNDQDLSILQETCKEYMSFYLFLANQILCPDKVVALVERVLDGAGRVGVNVEFMIEGGM